MNRPLVGMLAAATLAGVALFRRVSATRNHSRTADTGVPRRNQLAFRGTDRRLLTLLSEGKLCEITIGPYV